MKSPESCQGRNSVAQAELINHKALLKYQPDALPHPRLSLTLCMNQLRQVFNQGLAEEWSPHVIKMGKN